MREERDMATSTETNTAAEAQREPRRVVDSADSSEKLSTHAEDAWDLINFRHQDQLPGILQATPRTPKLSARAHAYAYVYV